MTSASAARSRASATSTVTARRLRDRRRDQPRAATGSSGVRGDRARRGLRRVRLARGGDLRLADPNGRALRVNPARRAFLTGYSVAGPGDVNGDGLSDLAVGAPADPFGRRPGPGSAWVVFGSSRGRGSSCRGLARAASGSQARAVTAAWARARRGGRCGRRRPGGSAGGRARRLRGDGPRGRDGVRRDRGSGDGHGRRTRAGARGDRGFALRGLPGDQAGLFVAAPGDIDGDGRPELAIAAPRSCAGAAPRFAGEETERSSAAVVYLATVGVLVATRSTDERDRLDAARGGERLRGRGGADLLRGSAAADCLYGDRGPDRVLGRGGGDVLLGGTGRDRLSGGDGTDLLHAADGSRDVVHCGAGRDRAVVDRHDRASRCERVRVR